MRRSTIYRIYVQFVRSNLDRQEFNRPQYLEHNSSRVIVVIVGVLGDILKLLYKQPCFIYENLQWNYRTKGKTSYQSQVRIYFTYVTASFSLYIVRVYNPWFYANLVYNHLLRIYLDETLTNTLIAFTIGDWATVTLPKLLNRQVSSENGTGHTLSNKTQLKFGFEVKICETTNVLKIVT